MMMCAPHWTALREAITERGLGVLVAENGEEVARRLASERATGPSLDNYEPLLTAHMAIVANAIKVLGPMVKEMMSPKADGSEWCPICYLDEKHAEHCEVADCTNDPFDVWIGKAADDQVAEWKRRCAQ